MSVELSAVVVRHRLAILVVTGIAAMAAAVLGTGAVSHFKGGGLVDPASESAVAQRELAGRYHAANHNVVLVADVRGGPEKRVDGPTASAEGRRISRRLADEPGVADVQSYWSTKAPSLRSRDGRKALILVQVAGDENSALKRLGPLLRSYTSRPGALDVRATGTLSIERELEDNIKADLTKAESVVMPITLILLVIIFGTVTAALLPLLAGGIAIVGTLAVLRLLEMVTDVSVFALNLTTALALGLGIDYALLVVSRFRAELGTGLTPDQAAIRCVQTAGRTILFSSATVASALASLLVFPQFFLRSFAYAGMAVCLLAAFSASVLLPALLSILGNRVESLTVRRKRLTGRHVKGFWVRVVERVMRRPVVFGGAVTLVLVMLGLPFLSAQFGLPDDRVLPKGATSRVASDEIRADFAGRETGTILVLATSGVRARSDITRYATRLSEIDGVSRVDSATGSYADGRVVVPASAASQRFRDGSSTYLSVVPDVEPLSPAGEALVDKVRAAPRAFPVLVGGQSAELVDAKASMAHHVPRALLTIGCTTFVLLFLMLGSVLLPLKAIVLNLLSLTALYGAMVWVFQDGHLAGALGFTATGTLNLAIPVLMFCISFGLSMDYEVFLMSRIKEERDHGADNETAVATGLQQSGGIITAAALVMSVVFLSFATSGVALIKLFGIGVTLAVIMDAAVIRPVMVPSFMRLAGAANWWAPRPLRAFHDRFGWVEHRPRRRPADPPGEPVLIRTDEVLS